MTRHNAGWLFIDFCQVYLSGKSIAFEHKSKFGADVSTVDLPDRRFLLVKPTTFMNDSGKAVRKLLDFYRLDPKKELFLVHDDLDLPFGDFKVSRGKGPKVHNGVNSVVQAVGTEDFIRLRLGISNDWLPLLKGRGGSVADDFVLDDFLETEQKQMPHLFQNALIELNQYSLR